MSKLKASKKNHSRVTAITGIFLVVLGVSLLGYSNFAIQEREQLLTTADLTPDELWRYEGSLNWWRTTYATVFFPLTIVFVALGALVLCSRQFLKKTHQKHALETRLLETPGLKKSKSMAGSIDNSILHMISTKKPETVDHLVKFVRQDTNFSDEEILNRVLTLQSEGKIKLKMVTSTAAKFVDYKFSSTYWYWLTLIFTGITLFLVLQTPENDYALVYSRYFFGTFFVLLLPGYTLVRALYPRKMIDFVERIGLSISMSIALVCLVAFFLNFSPLGILVLPLVVSISLIITVFATVAVIRERYVCLSTN